MLSGRARVGVALILLGRVSLGSLALVQFPAPQEPNKTNEQTPKIKVEVTLVELTATVVDRLGRPVPDLTRDDFLVSEDGASQQIAVFQGERDVPVSVGILFDTSGSMVDKIDEVKDAVVHFIETTNPKDEIFLVQFSAGDFLVQDFTDERQRLRIAVGQLRAQGSTSLYDAIVDGLRHLQEARYKRKALLVITDGNDTSSQTDLQQAIDSAIKSEVPIYSLGIGHGEGGIFGHVEGQFKDTVDIDVLRRFSNLTGGRAFLLQGAHRKHGVDQVDQACQEVSAELRLQYSLGYYPQNRARDGKYRRIRVEVKTGKFKVRTRDGYFGASASDFARPET